MPVSLDPPPPAQADPRPALRVSRGRSTLFYVAMLASTIGAYLLIRTWGEGLPREPSPGTIDSRASAMHTSALGHVLFALAAITLLARVLGGLVKRLLGQPAVIGEIIAGLLLGPSVLGALWPEASSFVLPEEAAPFLGIVAKIGVVLFLFLVGLELDTRMLRGSTEAAVAISHASMVTPFLLGAGLALWIFPAHAPPGVSFTIFSLFVGAAMSVTAFPVLARILTDRHVHRTRLGVTALTCAAVDDVSAWTLLALVAGFATSSLSGAAWTVPLVGLYLLVMLFVVRPAIRPLVERAQSGDGPLSRSGIALVFVGLLLSAAATEALGIHALFGAFMLGAILPSEGRLPEQLREKLQDVVVVLFLPSFFAFTGMRTQIGLLDDPQAWLQCGLIILVATAGKFGGTLVAARLVGMGWRRSAALGILMNTRGLMELIVLNLGLDLGVISHELFAMLVLMALVTTFATTPLLDLILGKRGFADDAPEVELAAARKTAH